MKLMVNGQAVVVRDELNVTDFLVDQKVKMPEMVSVELNGKILKRVEFDTTILHNNDTVELLYFMGGGRELN